MQQKTPSVPDCTMDLVVGAVGMVLIRSNTIIVRALGVAITTFCTLHILEKWRTLQISQCLPETRALRQIIPLSTASGHTAFGTCGLFCIYTD